MVKKIIFSKIIILEGGTKFKASAVEICKIDGEEANKQALKSQKDGLRQFIKYKRETFFDYVKFNLTFL